MISSALIFYDSRQCTIDLQFIAKVIESETQWRVSHTEWKGFGLIIPQVLVHTSIPFVIQIEDDPEWVPESNLECAEMAGLSKNSEIFVHLTQCDARLAIQSAMPDQVIDDGTSLTVVTLGDAVDPKDPEIETVLLTLGRKMNGLLEDCVNGCWTQCNSVC